ncbi:DUF3575 domain-containing protein [Rufibacter latericius]|uniref:DUF3575 domain-containing protein n=1 Tax=Rufibacter latericius TaxID=2487040 RepID=A0A3M9MN44_9BACT|nr:DUF3575 domain-containing protein [Rufibacter latericius]RNI26962.1 DUF3575 domain-containing protein [Rufibacter latericius]
MKKLFVVFSLFFLISVPQMLQAQHVTLKANVFSPIVKTGSFFGEFAFSPQMSAQIGYFKSGMKVKDTKFDGYGITPEVRYFFMGNAPSGFYGAGYLRYQDFDLTREDTEAKGTLTSFGGGALVGYQLIISKHFVLDAFAGPGFNAATVKGGGGEKDFDLGTFGGFSPRAGLSVGLAF